MKKWMRWMSLVLVLAMGLSVTTLAAGVNDGITNKFDWATAEFIDGTDKIQLNVTSSSIVPENQYLVVMRKGLSEDSFLITEGNVLYIDQQAAGSTVDGAGTLSFEIYPSIIQDSVILISGVIDGKSGPVVLAVVKSENTVIIVGDVNGNGFVDAGDAGLILRYSVKLIGADDGDFSEKIADLNHSGSINSADASLILQFVAGFIPYEDFVK